jgi:hypothetical protein
VKGYVSYCRLALRTRSFIRRNYAIVRLCVSMVTVTRYFIVKGISYTVSVTKCTAVHYKDQIVLKMDIFWVDVFGHFYVNLNKYTRWVVLLYFFWKLATLLTYCPVLSYSTARSPSFPHLANRLGPVTFTVQNFLWLSHYHNVRVLERYKLIYLLK